MLTMSSTSSTELATTTVHDLCRQVIHYTGTDRSSGHITRFDADWQQPDHDGQMLNLRLIQQISGIAFYTLRVENAINRQRSNYRISPFLDSVEQQPISHNSTVPFSWPPSTIKHLFLGAFNDQRS